MKNSCIICKSEFETSNDLRLTCSNSCAASYRCYKRNGYSEEEMFQRYKEKNVIYYCPICNKKFKKNKSTQQTCSKQCAQKFRFLNMPNEKRKEIGENIRVGKQNRSKEDKEKTRKRISEAVKLQWQEDPEKMMERFQEDFKETISKIAIENWKNPEYRHKMRCSLEKYWTDENRKKHSSTMKKFFKDNPEIGKMISEFHVELWKDLDYRKNRKENWNDPKWREEVLMKYQKTVGKKSRWHVSGGEKVFKKFLIENNLTFTHQKYVNVLDDNVDAKFYVIDFEVNYP